MYVLGNIERRREGVSGPGSDLLFRRLSGSTIGAEGFHGRVRDGIGCLAPRYGHQAGNACPWHEQGRPAERPAVLASGKPSGRRSGGLSCERPSK
jgi:hypothetical protein